MSNKKIKRTENDFQVENHEQRSAKRSVSTNHHMRLTRKNLDLLRNVIKHF